MGKKRKQKPEVFELADISPLTDNQSKAFKSNKNLVLMGSAGTGKSFIACYFACKDLFNKRDIDQIVIVRSAVPTRDIGFLPGTDKEKGKIYEEPYLEIFSDILCRGDAYSILKSKDAIEFLTTSYMRGITLRDSYLIVDEVQNMTFHELDSVITRVGDNCRIIFCGDFKQADLRKNGMGQFLRVLEQMDKDFDIIEFTPDDIVRSDFVKRYIKTKEATDLRT